MARTNRSKKKVEPIKLDEVKMNKISIVFRRSIMKQILKILTMEHGGFRTFKSMKNINRLFTNIDMAKYKNNYEAETYIWCINYITKQWLSGVVSPDIIIEMMRKQPEYNNTAEEIITECLNDPNPVTAPEAKALFDIVSEALQYGFVASIKEEYIELLDDINLDEPGAFKSLVERLFTISQSLLDIKHNTNMVANKVEFNTADYDSVREAITSTIDSLKTSNNIFKTGIRRLNTLLSPGYMNGKLYAYLGLPASGKSLLLLKTALDIRKYNPDYKPKTPGMKPCVLYITMENTFNETIERIWNMTFDEPIINYSEDQALEKICGELGIVMMDAKKDEATETQEGSLTDLLSEKKDKEHEKKSNIEIVVQYYPYRSISTDDLFTIIEDLRDENMEVCALVFDYIKRIEPATPAADNVKLELNRIINELKALAVIKDIPVITAHQMNRAAASTVDTAVRQGKGDVNKLVGRENVGDAWEIIESIDWGAVLNTEYRPGTEEKYITINVVKRRRIDSADSEFERFTYLAHPFARNNGLRLIDDVNLDKVLSLQSLVSDIDLSNNKEKTNAAPRLQHLVQSVFEENF